MKDPIIQATSQHHAKEADYQRRAEALTEEIYADLQAHLDEIVEFTDTEAALRRMLAAYLPDPNNPSASDRYVPELLEATNVVIDAAVKKIVERRLEP